MRQYLDLVANVLDYGEARKDRTGTGTLSIFGYQAKYDLRDGFPLLTTKKVMWSGVVRELLWFLGGSTNINDGLTQYTPIWDAWADANGDLGPIYGHQWRRWGAPRRTGVDQISNAIHLIKTDPTSRRIIVSAWNVEDIPLMALAPCHTMFQFYVCGGRLDLQLYQRSADIALGLPFNIASYALLLTIIAQECGLTPGVFVHSIGDAHIYLNHVDGLREQLTREPYPLPRVEVARVPLKDLEFEHIKLHNYQHHPFIKFEVAV